MRVAVMGTLAAVDSQVLIVYVKILQLSLGRELRKLQLPTYRIKLRMSNDFNMQTRESQRSNVI